MAGAIVTLNIGLIAGRACIVLPLLIPAVAGDAPTPGEVYPGISKDIGIVVLFVVVVPVVVELVVVELTVVDSGVVELDVVAVVVDELAVIGELLVVVFIDSVVTSENGIDDEVVEDFVVGIDVELLEAVEREFDTSPDSVDVACVIVIGGIIGVGVNEDDSVSKPTLDSEEEGISCGIVTTGGTIGVGVIIVEGEDVSLFILVIDDGKVDVNGAITGVAVIKSDSSDKVEVSSAPIFEELFEESTFGPFSDVPGFVSLLDPKFEVPEEPLPDSLP